MLDNAALKALDQPTSCSACSYRRFLLHNAIYHRPTCGPKITDQPQLKKVRKQFNIKDTKHELYVILCILIQINKHVYSMTFEHMFLIYKKTLQYIFRIAGV